MNKLPKEYLAHRQFCVRRINRLIELLESCNVPTDQYYRQIKVITNCITVENIRPVYSRIYEILRQGFNFSHNISFKQGKEYYLQAKGTDSTALMKELDYLIWIVKLYYIEVEDEVFGDIKIDKIILEELFGKEDE